MEFGICGHSSTVMEVEPISFLQEFVQFLIFVFGPDLASWQQPRCLSSSEPTMEPHVVLSDSPYDKGYSILRFILGPLIMEFRM